MSKLKELFLSKKELEKKKKDLMADAGGGGGAGGGGAGAGGGAGSGAGAGSGGGGGAGNSSGGGAHGNSSGMGGSAVSGDTGSADSTPSAPSGFHGIGTYMPGAKPKKKKKKKNFKFGDGIYERLMNERKIGDKLYNRNELPQIKMTHLDESPYKYTLKEMELEDIIPVQTDRVKGLVKSSEYTILKNKYKPLVVDKEGYLVNGHHRYDAAHNLNLDKVNVIQVHESIEKLVSEFSNLVSDTKVIESPLAVGIRSHKDLQVTDADAWTIEKYNKGESKINPIDVLSMFIKDDAKQYIFTGLRMDPMWQNTREFYKYSPAYRSIALQSKKIGFGESKKVSARATFKSSPAQTTLPGMGEAFPRLEEYELTGNGVTLKLYHHLDLILEACNKIEKDNPIRQRLKDKIESAVVGNPKAGYKIKNDTTYEYNKLTDMLHDMWSVIRNNIEPMVKELYKIRNILNTRSEENVQVPNEHLDTYLKNILDEKIDRNLKSNKH